MLSLVPSLHAVVRDYPENLSIARVSSIIAYQQGIPFSLITAHSIGKIASSHTSCCVYADLPFNHYPKLGLIHLSERDEGHAVYIQGTTDHI
jgi:hypothetical protein